MNSPKGTGSHKFGSMVTPSPGKPHTKFLQDVNGHRVLWVCNVYTAFSLSHPFTRKLPDRCLVNKTELQDSFLVSSYEGLPNLMFVHAHFLLHSHYSHPIFSPGVIEGWNRSRGPGQILFVYWGEQCPGMDYEWVMSLFSFQPFRYLTWFCSTAFAAVTFQKKSCYVNPSRASPLDVHSVNTSPDGSQSVLYAGNSLAVLVSSVCSFESYIFSTPSKGLMQHYVSGIFHSQEWERFCAFICMVFGHAELTGQLALDVLSFSTKTAGARESC